MKGKNKITDITKIESVMDLLNQESVKVAELITGLLVSEKKDYKLSIGKLTQGLLKGQMFTQLGKEVKDYQDKGKIKEDYFATNNNKSTFYELIKFIDEEIPEEERFKAMKSIFLTSISIDADTKDEQLAYEMLQICKKLNGSDILILKSAFNISNEKGNSPTKTNLSTHNAIDWAEMVSKEIGYDIKELVLNREERLEMLNLISARTQPSNYNTRQVTFTRTASFRLTPLGYRLCVFITKYS